MMATKDVEMKHCILKKGKDAPKQTHKVHKSIVVTVLQMLCMNA